MPSMTVDPAEVAQFDALSTEWWDPKGPFAPLHRFTPVRMDYFRSRLTRHSAAARWRAAARRAARPGHRLRRQA